MTDVKTLIDKAANLCGSQAELSRRVGVDTTSLSLIKNGKRPISPETVALLGDVLELPGEEVQRLAAWAVIENAKNAGKRERLKRAFFGVWALGVVGALLTAAPTEAQAKKTNDECRVTLYTLSSAAKRFAGLLWARFAPAKAAQILMAIQTVQRPRAAGCGL